MIKWIYNLLNSKVTTMKCVATFVSQSVKLDFQDGENNESLDCILLSVLDVMLGSIFFLVVILGESSINYSLGT